MMKIRLLKGCPVNGSSVCTNCASKADQEAYFDAFEHIDHEVNTVRMGEPFRIADSIEHLMPYNYGYIQYEDGGFRYYFYVADMAMITETQTEIRYNLDPYEITCFQGGLEVTRAMVSRYPTTLIDSFLPSEPYEWVISTPAENQSKGTFVAMVSTTIIPHDPQTGKEGNPYTSTSLYVIPLTDATVARFVFAGDWLGQLIDAKDIPPSDIYGAWYVPFEHIPTSHTVVNRTGSPYDIYEYPLALPLLFNLGFDTLSSSIWFRDRIVDARGTPLFECGVNRDYIIQTKYINDSWEEATGVYGVLDYSAGSAGIRLTVCSGHWEGTGDNKRPVVSNDRTDIIIPCENVDIYSDSWAEYYYRSRDADKALRSLDRDTTAIRGIVSSAGRAAGSAIGNPANAQSTAGNFVGDAISAVGEWAVASYYDPKYQEQYDRKAKNEADPVQMAGSATLAMFINNHAGKVTVTADPVSKSAISSDCNAYGYPTNTAWWDGDPRIYNGNTVTGPIKASLDIKADCPEQWIDIIEQRFAIGVRMVK